MLQIVPSDSFSGFKVPPHEVWRYLGYIDESKARPEIRKIFEKVMTEVGPSLLEPAACYDIFPVEKLTADTVQLDGVTFQSQDLAGRQSLTKEMALFTATAGARIGEEAEKLIASGDSVLGYVLDVYASAAVDTIAYLVRDAIDAGEASRGYRGIKHGVCLGKKCPAYKDCGGVVTSWWSPGYGDWSAKENLKVFSLMDGSKIGVKVNPSGMMVPRKSYACAMPLAPGGGKSAEKCVEMEREWMQRGSKSR